MEYRIIKKGDYYLAQVKCLWFWITLTSNRDNKYEISRFTTYQLAKQCLHNYCLQKKTKKETKKKIVIEKGKIT